MSGRATLGALILMGCALFVISRCGGSEPLPAAADPDLATPFCDQALERLSATPEGLGIRPRPQDPPRGIRENVVRCSGILPSGVYTTFDIMIACERPSDPSCAVVLRTPETPTN